jgi:hypothetical protein
MEVRERKPQPSRNEMTHAFFIAAILGSETLRQYLINYARPLIYSTFMSYSSLALIQTAYKQLESDETKKVHTPPKKTTLISYLILLFIRHKIICIILPVDSETRSVYPQALFYHPIARFKASC